MKNSEMKQGMNPLGNLFLNRELDPIERQQRTQEILFYLAKQGGLITAISCKDGILLTGLNPTDEKTVFQVFHRIGLLGVGKSSDCEAIHKFAQGITLRASLKWRKADIRVQDISKKIAHELDEGFSYSNSQRGLDISNPGWSKTGPYKADFIIAELGFDKEEDFIDLITFQGERSYKRKITGGLWAISESPRIVEFIINEEIPLENKNDEKGGKVKSQKIPILVAEIDEEYHPVMDGFCPLIRKLYFQEGVWTVKEAALFVGLAIRILDERGGRLEMAYLDRTMLQTSKTQERQFPHIWKWITNPNSYESLDPWQDWRKFVVPVYTKVKRGQLYPEQKFLIEIYEDLKKIGFDKKDELKKMKKQGLAKLIVHLLENKPQGK